MIPYTLLIRIIAPLLILIGIWMWGWSVGKTTIKKEWDLANAKAVAQALEDSEAARAKEEVWQIRLKESQREREKADQNNRRIANGLRAESKRLRNDLAAYASGTSEDTIAAVRERAIALGIALEEALRTSAICAEDAESLNADLRAVLNAWPTTGEK